MEKLERVIGMALAAAMLAYGISYFREYRYEMGRWIMGGMIAFAMMILAGCAVEWYEEYCENRALETLYRYSGKNRRIR